MSDNVPPSWVPPEQQTPTWECWVTRFQCRIPYINIKTTDEIRLYGTLSNGDKEKDRQMAKEPMLIHLTINEMVEHYRNGSNVSIVNQADTVKIYDLIMKHLAMWLEYVKWSGVTRNAPYADLIDMDRFATAVHGHAKFNFANNGSASTLFQASLNQLTSFSKGSFGRRAPTAAALNDEELDAAYPKRTELAAEFNAYKLEGGR